MIGGEDYWRWLFGVDAERKALEDVAPPMGLKLNDATETANF